MLDFSKNMLLLIEDITKKVPIFSHIKTQKILISCAEAKKEGRDGTWAQLYPMKYENGHYSIRERVGQRIYLYKTEELRIGRQEISYIIYFMMPRFQNLSYFSKLETIFHELYHISPEFDGRLRIIHPRFIFHGPSMKLYDRRVRYWIRQYQNSSPNMRRLQFLHYSLNDIKEKYGDMDMVYIPEPRETMHVMVSRRKKKSKKNRKGRVRA